MNVTKDLRLSGKERKNLVSRVLREQGVRFTCDKRKTGWSIKAELWLLNHRRRNRAERMLLRYCDHMVHTPKPQRVGVFNSPRVVRYFFVDSPGAAE